jgi:predicted Zn-dependent protease
VQLSLLCLFAFLFAGASWYALRVRRIDWRHWAGASILGLWIAGVGAKAVHDTEAKAQQSASALPGKASLAWPARGENEARDAGSSNRPVASSVESLIGPLAARLAAHPEDPKGWALLAQSYAYVGNEEDAERAVSQAVRRGVDEKALRERVAAAHRVSVVP